MEPIYEPISAPNVNDNIFIGSFCMFITTMLVDIIHIIDIVPCSIAPNSFLFLFIMIILSVDNVFSITLNRNISIYVIYLPLFYYGL